MLTISMAETGEVLQMNEGLFFYSGMVLIFTAALITLIYIIVKEVKR